MSDTSWWERKLLGGRSQPPTQPDQRGSPAPAPGFPQKAVRWQPSYPPTGPRQEVADDQSGGVPDDNWQRVNRQGYVAKAPASIGKDGRCPGCGGSNFFRRKGPMGTEAAPLCTECGYNGDFFTQSGTLLNSVGMKSSGPVQFARTDNPDADAHFDADPGMSSDFDWGAVR